MSRSTETSVVLVLLLLLGTFAGVPALGVPAEGFEDPLGREWPGALEGPASDVATRLLWLRAGAFDPLTDETPLALGLDGRSTRDVYMVQFEGPLSPATGDRLEAVGGRVMGYVPDGGLVVGFDRPATVLAVSLWRDVRWLCPWQDGWKVDPWLERAAGPIDLGVLAWDEGRDLGRDLRDLGGRVLAHQLDLYVVRIDSRAIPALAALPGVSWIEPWSTPTFMVDAAARSVGARQGSDGALNPDGTAVWSYDADADSFNGLTGKSVTVDITDTGVDGTHSAFNGRTQKYTSLIDTQPAWSDPIGHGTHVAGIVLGDGSYRASETQYYHDNFDGKYAGLAPGAYMIAQSLYGPNETFTYRNLTKWSVENGAQISQNSWGTWHSSVWGNYTIVSRDYDNSTRDADWTTPGNQSILVVFAAGNEGIYGNNTLSVTAVAKNVISVGATGNGKNVTAEDEVWLHSSRGWTDDGRIKPDLVAPGDDVTSTWGIDDNGASGDLPAEAGEHSYITYGGTSMSAPVVSGSAALVFDHLIKREGLTEPSPAVVKAILVASADHLDTSQWPGREQGWGRVNVSRAIVETRDNNMEFVDQTTKFDNVGQSQSYKYDVQAGQPLRVSLVWTDLPSHVYSGKMLINDLDLQVKSPSGQVYKGNVFGAGESITGGDADDTNNVEMVYIDSPTTGEWEVTVSSRQLPPVWGGGNQDFALSVVGNVNKKFVDIAAQNLSVRATDAAEGDLIPIVFDLANLGNLPAMNVPWTLNVMDEHGQLHERLATGFDDIAPRSGIRIYDNWTAVRGDYTIKVVPNPLQGIAEESYQNNNVSKRIFIKGFGVSGRATETLKDGLPGSDVEFDLNITNEGNVADLFLLSRSEPPTGWNARLDVTFLDIGPGGTKTATLTVTVPEGHEAGVTVQINVTVVSQGNDTHQVVIMTQTGVSPVYKQVMDLTPPSMEAAPGEDAVFEFAITNAGNAMDTYKVTYWQQSGPSEGVEFVVNRTSFATDVGLTVYGSMTVSLDAGSVAELPAGESITFIIKAESVNPSGGSVSVTGSVVIKQLESVGITPPFNEEIPGMPGEEVSLTFDVTNTGNGDDLLTPTATVEDGWEVRTSEPSVYLTAGETRTIQMWVTVSVTASAGSHPVTLRVLSEEEAELAAYTIAFLVDWVPRVTVALDGDWDTNMTQGEEVSFQFRVTNAGNGPDEVSVEFGGLSRGITTEARPESKALAQDEIGTFIIVFKASDDAELLAGKFRVTFVYAEGVERKTVQVNVTIEQKPIDPGPQGPDPDDVEDFLSGIVLWGIIMIVLMVVLAVAGYMVTNKARQLRKDAKLKEEFFKGGDRSERTTAAVLEEERASRQAPPPPPADVSAWEESPTAPTPAPAYTDTPAQAPAPAYSGGPATAPVPAAEPAPQAPTNCPDCGNALAPVGPGGGRYCPMCGYQENGPGPSGP